MLHRHDDGVVDTVFDDCGEELFRDALSTHKHAIAFIVINPTQRHTCPLIAAVD